MKQAIATLDEAGHVAYLVGGSVRDLLLRQPVKDYDLVTDADPDTLSELFPESIEVGKQFGVLKIPISRMGPSLLGGDEEFLEIATFREDQEYLDHRRPKSVRFAGPLEDAARRDFTINGLFYDPKTRRILDCVGGMDDLKAGVIRAIGDPAERFHEDALRILRAIRFTARFGFKLDEATLKALHSEVRFTRKVSAERIRDEITLMMKGRDPEVAYELMKETGVFSLWVPEALKAKVQLFAALDLSPTPRSTALVWAALLSEIGGEDPSKALQGACDRMRLSGDDKKRVIELVVNLPRFNDVFSMRPVTLNRWVREPFFPELLQLFRAHAIARDGNQMAYQFAMRLHQDALSQGENPKLISGEDLIQLGFNPGPTFSEILRVVEDLAIEKRLMTKDQALEYVLKHFVR